MSAHAMAEAVSINKICVSQNSQNDIYILMLNLNYTQTADILKFNMASMVAKHAEFQFHFYPKLFEHIYATKILNETL